MSLEAALAENTAALNKVAGLLETSNAGREAAIAAATAIQSGDKPASGRAKKTETKTDEKPAGPPSEQDVRDTFGTFLGVEDTAVRDVRKGQVKLILGKLGAGKATEITEGDRAQAITWVKAFAAGEAVPELEPAAAEKEESLI